MTFTWLDKVQSVTLVTSFFTVLIASVEWHFVRQAKVDDLPIGQKLKVVPFFMSAILMKTFVTSSLASTYMTLNHPEVAIALISALFLGQLILPFLLGYKANILTSIANLTTAAQPDAERTLDDKDQRERFFIYETRISTTTFGVLCAVNMPFAMAGKQDMWTAGTCFVLVAINFIISQAYLVTQFGIALLYPKTDTPSKNICQQCCQCLPKCFMVSDDEVLLKKCK